MQLIAVRLVVLAAFVALPAMGGQSLSLLQVDTGAAVHTHHADPQGVDHTAAVQAAHQVDIDHDSAQMNACPFMPNCAHQIASNCISLETVPMDLALLSGCQSELLLAMDTASLVNITRPGAPFRPPII